MAHGNVNYPLNQPLPPRKLKSYPFLVIARPCGAHHTIDMIKIVAAFSINSDRPVSSKQASEHFHMVRTNAEIRALRSKVDGDNTLLECIPHTAWSF